MRRDRREDVPLLAERNDRYTILRTCAQSSTHHQSAAYEALTAQLARRSTILLYVGLTRTASGVPGARRYRMRRGAARPREAARPHRRLRVVVASAMGVGEAGNRPPDQAFTRLAPLPDVVTSLGRRRSGGP